MQDNNINCNPLRERDLKADKRLFSKIGAGFAVFTVVSTIVSFAIMLTVMLINREFANSTLFKNLVTPISMYIFALPFLLVFLSGCPAEKPPRARLGFGKWVLLLIVAFGAMSWGSEIGNGIMEVISALVGYDYGNALESLVDGDQLWISIFFMVTVAPIGEELLFRKLIIDRTHRYGAFVSIGLSALLFGLTHGNLYQFFYCFLVGIILGYVYYSSGNILLSIAIHASLNFVGTVIVSLISPTADALMEADPQSLSEFFAFAGENALGSCGLLIYTAFMYGAMLCAIVLPLAFFKRLMPSQGDLMLPRGKVFTTVMLNVGMISLIIIYIFEFAINLLPTGA